MLTEKYPLIDSGYAQFRHSSAESFILFLSFINHCMRKENEAYSAWAVKPNAASVIRWIITSLFTNIKDEMIHGEGRDTKKAASK